MKLYAVLLGLGLGLGAAQASPVTSACAFKCIDGITECGERWGGCWNVCHENPPTPPKCPPGSTKLYGSSYTARARATPTPTTLLKRDNLHKPTTTRSSDCSTRTVCADYINECGLMYGGCFADCLPWPTFTPPPCPSDWSSTTTATPTATPTYGDGEDCGRTICEDLVNECGVMYGGCHPDCAPYPTYTPPPCDCPHETQG